MSNSGQYIKEKPDAIQLREAIEQTTLQEAASDSGNGSGGLRAWIRRKRASQWSSFGSSSSSVPTNTAPRPSSPVLTLSEPPPYEEDEGIAASVEKAGLGSSKPSEGPVLEDDEDKLIATLEQKISVLKESKRDWEFSRYDIEELDATVGKDLDRLLFRPTMTLIQEFFPDVKWEGFAEALARRKADLIESVNWRGDWMNPETHLRDVDLPYSVETWDEMLVHPEMTTTFFLHGLITLSIAQRMKKSPTVQVGTAADRAFEMSMALFSSGVGEREAGEWMAHTLELVNKTIYNSKLEQNWVVDDNYFYKVEDSPVTKQLIGALYDALSNLRDIIGRPLGLREAARLRVKLDSMVIDCLNLSMKWLRKPVGFDTRGRGWHFAVQYDQTTQAWMTTGNPSEEHKVGTYVARSVDGPPQHVVCVASPAFLRLRWELVTKDSPIRHPAPRVWRRSKVIVSDGEPPRWDTLKISQTKTLIPMEEK